MKRKLFLKIGILFAMIVGLYFVSASAIGSTASCATPCCVCDHNLSASQYACENAYWMAMQNAGTGCNPESENYQQCLSDAQQQAQNAYYDCLEQAYYGASSCYSGCDDNYSCTF